MRAISTILLFLALLGILHAQKPNSREALINITITDFDNTPLQTQVTFINSQKEYHFETDAEGKAICIVAINQVYNVMVKNSTMYYEYPIENSSKIELDVQMRFQIQRGSIANNKNAVLIISTLNLPKNKEMKIVEKGTQKLVSSASEDKSILLPLSNEYEVLIDGFNVRNNLIEVGAKANMVFYYVLHVEKNGEATMKRSDNEAFFTFKYINAFSNKSVPDETIQLESKQTGTTYKQKTGQAGTCVFVVPQGDTYYVHLDQGKDIIAQKVDTEEANYHFNFEVLYPNTSEILRRKKASDLRLTSRDREYNKKNTPLLKQGSDKKLAKQCSKLKKEALQKAKVAEKRLVKNKSYFKRTNNKLCAILYRLRLKWKSQILITDLTTSMDQRMRELIVWQSLKLMDKQQSVYAFFNDGNNKASSKKMIGKTGGLYYASNNSTDSIIKKMFEAKMFENDNDAPENDLEAILFALKHKPKFAELVLVADNYSPVRDLELLEQLNNPVRIILCDTKWGIHPDYIKIAHQTRGSLHTINEDIEFEKQIVDGEKIRIHGKTYIYTRGRFFVVNNRTISK